MGDTLLNALVGDQDATRGKLAQQDGAEIVQVIMIMGIIAIIITALFLSPLGLRDAIMGLGDKVKNAVNGAGVGG